MSNTSPVHNMPYLQPSQAQKHVTHNEALRHLDAIVQLSVKSRALDEPPSGPIEGDRYIVGNGAMGEWAGRDSQVAVWSGTDWDYFPPHEGWLTYVQNTDTLATFNGNIWKTFSAGLSDSDLQNLQQIGIGTSADGYNRLAVASDSTLLTAETDDHRLKINKASDDKTASLVFQSNWNGHAEMGLAGDTDFSVRVSSNGTTFRTALAADAATGIVEFPSGISFGDQTLAHYEEGTFTPVLSFDGDSTGITYERREGFYTRIGNMVVVQCAIDITSAGSATGNAQISGLPFDPDPSNYPGTLFFVTGGIGLSAPTCRALPGSKIGLYDAGNGGSSFLTDASFASNANFKICMTHFI